jgi:hypothetical protein
MQTRRQQDRRTATQRGVTGYDRRKRIRRASRDDAVAFIPGALSEHAEPQTDDLDFTIVRRQ